MLFSPTYNYLFIHCQKTGGKSIREQFWEIEPQGNLASKMHFGAHTNDDMQQRLHAHGNASYFKAMLHPKIWDGLYRFTVVRNPFDRIISWYWFNRHYRQIPREMSFDTYLHCRIEKEHYIEENLLQYWKIHDHTGTAMCEFFKFEDGLDNAVKQASTKINAQCPAFPIQEQLVRRDHTNIRLDRRHYREVFTPDQRKYWEEVCRLDFETFGYEW